MAISLVGSPTENSAINGANFTLTLPSGLAENDVVYVFAAGHSYDSSLYVTTSSSGWTRVADRLGTYVAGAIFRKKMGATPSTSINITFLLSDTDDAGAAIAFALRGVDTTTQEDATTTEADIVSAYPNSPSITTATSGAWVFSFFATNATDLTPTAPTGYSNQVDRSPIDVHQLTIGGAAKTVSLAGAENPGAWGGWNGGSGVAFTLAVRPSLTGYELDLDAGSFAYTGTAASLEYNREIAGASGSFAVTGTAVGLQLSTTMTAGGGSFAFTGKVINWDIFGSRGTFAVTGANVNLTISTAPVLAADAGSFAVTGATASLEFGHEVAASVGAYTYTGTAASLEYGREVAAAGSSFAFTGTDADVFHTQLFEIAAQAGSFGITGTDAQLYYTEVFTISAQTGSYSFTGDTVNLTLAAGPLTCVSNPVAYGPVTFLRTETTGTTEQIGSVLACTTGVWTSVGMLTFTYQWRRAGTNISGATSNCYTLEQADSGASIDCVVTAIDVGGSVTQDSNNITCETESFTVRSHYRKVTGMHGGGTMTFTTTTEETP